MGKIIAISPAVNQKFSNLDGEDLVDAIIDDASNNPTKALTKAKFYAGQLPREKLIEVLAMATFQNPDAALVYAKDYIDLIPEDMRTEILTSAMLKAPQTAVDYIDNFFECFPEQGYNQRDATFRRVYETIKIVGTPSVNPEN